MSTHDDRRHGQGAGRPGPNQGDRQPRQRRGPLFPLEADDIAPSPRRAMPAPLGDLLGDLDDELPPRPTPPREPAPERRPAPAPGRPPAPPQRPIAPAPPSAGARSASGADTARRPQAQAQASAARPTLTQAAPARGVQELRPPLLTELLEEQVPAIEAARARYESTERHLNRLELSEARPRLGGYTPPPAPPAFSLQSGVLLVVICLASLLVLLTMRGQAGSSLSGWNPIQRAGDVIEQSSNALVASARVAGDYALKGPPSVTPQQIDRILEAYGSPAAGTGQDWYNLGLQYGIDPAFAVAFFIHESSAGSNPNWAGIKPGGGTTHNVGNIICAGYATCFGRFRDYPSWSAGIEDWYRLIDVEYIQGRGHRTVADIIPVYAPSFENDVQGYVNAVHGLIDQWRTEGVQ